MRDIAPLNLEKYQDPAAYQQLGNGVFALVDSPDEAVAALTFTLEDGEDGREYVRLVIQ
jgi:hypothetical protein